MRRGALERGGRGEAGGNREEEMESGAAMVGEEEREGSVRGSDGGAQSSTQRSF